MIWAGLYTGNNENMNLIQRALRRARYEADRHTEKFRLGRLYSPDVSNLDPVAHLDAALDWLKRAQDAGDDRGVSWGNKFGSDFLPSYPETTGYICQTFVQMARRTGDQEFLQRAIEMGLWEIDVQMPEGAVMGGKVNPNPKPAVFNTGMVLLGWAELIRATGDDRFKTAASRASDWLLRMQDEDGNWRRGNSPSVNPGSTLYNVKAAWGLCEAGFALGREDYVAAAVRNAEYCLSRQNPNGWFRDCCLDDPIHPLLHTLAYTMQGLVEIGRLTGRKDFVAASRLTADAEIGLFSARGFLPGRQDSEFRPAATWCCLSGSSQTSIVWSALGALTGESKYYDAADSINGYLMAHHDIRNPDPRMRGGLAGSWPVTGEFGRLQILNWGTKFFVDALAARHYRTRQKADSPESRSTALTS